METISKRFKMVSDEINMLANERSWQKGKINLVVVTKKKNIEDCIEVIEAGAKTLGENYVDEAAAKFKLINPQSINLHMIGHLQSRKIKLLFPLFTMIQTIDSIHIAEKMNKFYEEKGILIDSLIEINMTSEETKSGFTITNQTEEFSFLKIFEKLNSLPFLRLKGLMTMGYFPQDENTNCEIFKRIKILLEKLKEKYELDDFNELSMGTSMDYRTAIREGSTMVRIGEKIMGTRKG